jgi:hypothetical protein
MVCEILCPGGRGGYHVRLTAMALDIHKTNIPDCREAFRFDNLREELEFLHSNARKRE